MKKPRYGKMKKEWKNKWVKALRSWKYEQTGDNLMDMYDGERRYCCLGVLEEVVRGRPITVRQGLECFPADLITKKVMVAKSYDCDEDGYLEVYKKCATLNDENKLSFKRIAAWIEKNL